MFKNYGLEITGAPIGSDEFVINWMEHKIYELKKQSEKLQLIKDSQTIFCILKNSFIHKLSFLLRTNEPRLIKSHVVEQFDDILKSLFSFTTEYDPQDITPLSWNIARLKGADGGAGIGFLVDTIDAAYVASMTSSLYSMQSALSNSKTIIDNEINKESILTQLDYEIPSALQSYFDSISYLSNMEVSLTQVNDNPIISLQTLRSLNKSSHKGLQRILAAKLKSLRREQVLQYLTDFDTAWLASFISNSSYESYAWCEAKPVCTSHKMIGEYFSQSMRRRCLMHEHNIPTNSICKCKRTIDPLGFHLQTCSQASAKERVNTHDAITYTWGRLCRAGDYPTTIENRCFRHLLSNGTINEDNKRMDIVTKANFDTKDNSFSSSLLDISIANAVTRGLTSANASRHGRVADLAAHAKHEHYDDAVADYNNSHPSEKFKFYPIILEVQGSMCDEAKRILRHITNKIASKSSTKNAPMIHTFWLRTVSVTLQTNVARQIIEASKRLHPKSSDDDTHNNSLAFYHHASDSNSTLNKKKRNEISTSFPPSLISLTSPGDI
jgi:hypothetical protein